MRFFTKPCNLALCSGVRLRAVLPAIVTCSPVIIHTPALALCEGICPSVQRTTSLADDAAVAASAALAG